MRKGAFAIKHGDNDFAAEKIFLGVLFYGKCEEFLHIFISIFLAGKKLVQYIKLTFVTLKKLNVSCLKS